MIPDSLPSTDSAPNLAKHECKCGDQNVSSAPEGPEESAATATAAPQWQADPQLSHQRDSCYQEGPWLPVS